MEERRKHQRTEVNQPGYVSSGGSVMSCMVRNVSPEGAAIDVENPDWARHPRFRHAVPWKTTLEAGEVLYLPYAWWHWVRGMEVSISVNF